MRKNDLIKLLESVKGNPEVMLWNGFVEDVVPLSKDYTEETLYKHSKEFLMSALEGEYRRDHDINYSIPLSEEAIKTIKEKTENAYRNTEYTLPNPFLGFEEYKNWYGRKKSILILQPKLVGKTCFDRIGEINY